VLLLAGALRPLVEDVGHAGAAGAEGFGLAVVRAVLVVVPDLRSLGVLAGPAAGRALDVPALAAWLPFAPYALVALLLVVLPGRAGRNPAS
jgi:hypothetical protein